MRFQCKEGFCGPAAIQNAFRVHGKRISQARIGKACLTTSDGTDSPEMIAGIRSFNFNASEYSTNDPIAGWSWILECLRNEKPIIVCTLSWRHWVTVVGNIGNKLIIIDSTNENFNFIENGIAIQNKKDFMKRWAKNDNLKSIYYGISIGKK